MFVVHFTKNESVVIREKEFTKAREALEALERSAPIGTYQIGYQNAPDALIVRICRGCGKTIPSWKARCLTCSAVGNPRIEARR